MNTAIQLVPEAIKLDLFDTPAAVQHAAQAWADSPEIQQHAALVQRWGGKADWLLDLGCGVGRQAALMRFKFYIGIDQSAAMIAEAESRYANVSSMQFHIGNIFEPEPALHAQPYDLAICLDVLQHQTDPCAAFHQLIKTWQADRWIISFLLGTEHEELLVTTVCGFKEYLTMLDKVALLDLHMHRIPPNELAWVFMHFRMME